MVRMVTDAFDGGRRLGSLRGNYGRASDLPHMSRREHRAALGDTGRTLFGRLGWMLGATGVLVLFGGSFLEAPWVWVGAPLIALGIGLTIADRVVRSIRMAKPAVQMVRDGIEQIQAGQAPSTLGNAPVGSYSAEQSEAIKQEIARAMQPNRAATVDAREQAGEWVTWDPDGSPPTSPRPGTSSTS